MLGELKLKLRTLKPFWWLHNLAHWRALRGNRRLYDRFGVKKSVFAPIAHRDFPVNGDERPWLDRGAPPPATAPEAESLPEGYSEKVAGWAEDGFIVLEGFCDAAQADAVVAEVDRLLAEGVVKPHFRGQQVVRDSYRDSDAVRSVLTDPRLGKLLAHLFGRRAQLFQTIDFFHGSQQPLHSDAFHMTTQPPGFLIGAWLALEDVSPDAGPVYYLPGSHRLPYVMSEDLGLTGSALTIPLKDDAYGRRVAQMSEESGVEPVEFLAKKGDLLLWHHNLLHGGRPVEREDSTRRSLVAHYFADEVVCYHEVTERPAILAGAVPLAA